MSCFAAAPPLSACLAEAPPVCILHIVPPSASVPFASPPACLWRVPVSRVAWARAPASAPARSARLVARASQAQGARLLYLSDCICIGGAALGLRNRKGGPASRLSSTPILPRLPPCQIPGAAGPEFSPMSRPEGRVYPPLCHPGRRVSADPGSSLPGRCRVSRAVLDPGSGAGVTIEEGRGDS